MPDKVSLFLELTFWWREMVNNERDKERKQVRGQDVLGRS